MTTFVEDLVRVPWSENFAFTPGGRHLARLTNLGGGLAVEVRDLRTVHPPHQVHGPDPLLESGSQLSFPAPDRVYVCGDLPGGFRIVEVYREGATWRAEPVAECDAVLMRLLPRLAGANWDLAISWAEDVSTIWRIDPDRPRLRPLAEIPGFVRGGTWLDSGRELAADIVESGGRSSGYVLDLHAQTYQRVFHVSDSSDDRIAGYDNRRGLLAVVSNYCGYRQPGVAELRGDRQVRFFPESSGEDRHVDVCGHTPDGRLILRRQVGVRGELRLGDPVDLSVSAPLRLPEGVVGHPVVWSADRIRFPFTTPTVPSRCAAYLPAEDRFVFEEPPDLGGLNAGDLVTPRRVCCPGPRGDIETLVYEPSPDRRRPLLVVALHGGPVGQWSAAFTPELQLFAGLGATVVAPNYHGSFGYGSAFMRALEGRAGVVDLDDVIAVTAAAQDATGPVMTVLYGHSYGAFLALLAAAVRPRRCDGVIAVAPFTSLPRMRAVGAPVRRLVELLQGAAAEERADLLGRCADLRARLLIAHGTRDEVIPSDQSYMLCQRLRDCGYRDDHDLWFLPLQGEGHDIR